jgi:protein involved in polysaccharide export with SLBB domain
MVARALLLLLLLASPALAAEPVEPFGSNLFSGAFSAERDDGLSGDYRIMPGDRITVRLWGAVTVDDTPTVDAQGNIFIPDVGPVRVGGVRAADLNDVVGRKVRATYHENVEVYTNLHGTQPVAVFVTGQVMAPGMYAGVATDSILYYLDRAGGIDPGRGSWRQISVIRAGATVARFDLYAFLLDGHLPPLQLRDGDTILVAPRGPAIVVEGLGRVSASFEFLGQPVSGREVLELAMPRVEASHVAVEGERAAGPFSLYVSMDEFRGLALRDGDRIRLERGRPQDTLLVRIEGEHLGPSAMAVPVGTSLLEVLDRVEVDPRLADVKAVYLRRASVARRQKEALEESLNRLEASVLGATSQSEGEVQIRVQEADLVARFVERARLIEPEGRLMVGRNGEVADIRIEPGDVIVVPALTDVIMVHGEVAFPRAVVHRPDARIDDYIEQAGGFTDRAERSQIVVRRANGEIELGRANPVRPGDEIHVLPRVDTKSMQIAKDIFQIMYQIAISAAVVLAL